MSSMISKIVSSSTNQMILSNMYNTSVSGGLSSVIGDYIDANNKDKTTDSATKAATNKTLTKLQDYAKLSNASITAYQAEVNKGSTQNKELTALKTAYSSVIKTNSNGTYSTTKTSIKPAISAEYLIASK